MHHWNIEREKKLFIKDTHSIWWCDAWNICRLLSVPNVFFWKNKLNCRNKLHDYAIQKKMITIKESHLLCFFLLARLSSYSFYEFECRAFEIFFRTVWKPWFGIWVEKIFRMWRRPGFFNIKSCLKSLWHLCPHNYQTTPFKSTLVSWAPYFWKYFFQGILHKGRLRKNLDFWPSPPCPEICIWFCPF